MVLALGLVNANLLSFAITLRGDPILYKPCSSPCVDSTAAIPVAMADGSFGQQWPFGSPIACQETGDRKQIGLQSKD